MTSPDGGSGPVSRPALVIGLAACALLALAAWATWQAGSGGLAPGPTATPGSVAATIAAEVEAREQLQTEVARLRREVALMRARLDAGALAAGEDPYDEDLAPLREDERWAPLMKKYHPDAQLEAPAPKKDEPEKPDDEKKPGDEKKPEKKDG